MLIKNFKYKNKIIGNVHLCWDDNDGYNYYYVYTGKLNDNNGVYLNRFDSKEEALTFAEDWFSNLIELKKEDEKQQKLYAKIYKKQKELLAKFTNNYTKQISDFDKDLMNRVLQEYAFRLGLH